MRNVRYPLFGLFISIAAIAMVGIAMMGSSESMEGGVSSSGVSAASIEFVPLDNSPGQTGGRHDCGGGGDGDDSHGTRGCLPHTPVPTPTHTATAVPTAVPTAIPPTSCSGGGGDAETRQTCRGSLTASDSSIGLNETTRVRVSNVSPSNLSLRLSYSRHLTTSSACGGGGGDADSVSRFTAPHTVTLRGCIEGTATVRLLTRVGSVELDSLQIEVGGSAPSPVPPAVPTAVLTAPPHPDGFSVTAASNGTQFVFSWTAVTGANRYRLQRYVSANRWSTFYTTSSTSFHSRHNLTGCQTQQYRIASYGDGTTYATGLGEYSAGVSVSTTACSAPQFGANTYAATIAEDAYVGDSVTSVLATDPDGHSISYSIADGNSSGQFAINPRSGAVTVAGILDYELARSHRLTVQATDSSGETDTARVRVTVTNVFESSVSLSTTDPLVGQIVFLTAWTDAPSGQRVSYQWQEMGSSGRTPGWSSVATATTVRRQVSFNTAATKTYRVVASYGSGNTAASAPVRLEWRTLSALVKPNSSDPDTGDTVRLSAQTDSPPTGGPTLTHQWQMKSTAGVWANISGATSATYRFRSSTRGVREFRVKVSHGGISVVSPSAFIVWDEYAIVDDMVTALTSAVTASSSYRTAQTSFLSCVNRDRAVADRYGSFDQVMADYAKPVTKARVTSCGTDMFTTIERVYGIKLSSLKNTNTTYAAILQTPQGREFEQNLGDATALKTDALLLSRLFAVDSAETDSTDTNSQRTVTHGFEGCLHVGTVQLADMFTALNCIIFEKPHSLWVELKGNAAKRTAFMDDISRIDFPWLHHQNFACSNTVGALFITIDLPDPEGGVSCLKHDLAYGSLQQFVADGPGLQPANNMDAAWSPRNKYLADHIFLIDGICGMKTGQERRECVPDAINPNKLVSAIMLVSWFTQRDYRSIIEWVNPRAQHLAVAQGNSKLWPITNQDVDHVKADQQFVDCAAPGITGSPTVRHVAGTTFQVLWQPSSGCTPITSTYSFCFGVMLAGSGRQEPYCSDYSVLHGQSYGYGTFTLPPSLSEWRALGLVSARIIPQDRAYPRWAVSYPRLLFPYARWLYRTRSGQVD